MSKRVLLLGLVVALILLFLIFPIINKINITQLDDTGTVKITINFLLPVEHEGIERKIHFTSERPGTTIINSFRWIDEKTLEIFAMEEGLPKGFKTKLNIKPLKTKIPGLRKKVNICYRANIPPFLTKLSPIIPSKGPLVLNFSTPIRDKELRQYLKTDFEFNLTPGYVFDNKGKPFIDYSKWLITPKAQLIPGTRHRIDFDGILHNIEGQSKKAGFTRIFDVAGIPEVESTDPEQYSKDVVLYKPIEINFNYEMKDVKVEMSGMKGDVKVNGKKAIYYPHSVYMPQRIYSVKVYGESIFGEEMEPYTFKFSTVDMENKLWVEINMRSLQKVVVYQGDRVIRTMLASGGLPQPENATPRGFFYLKDRGESFWTERISEGGLYWVRIKGNYLIHSLPRDKEGNIIDWEAKKLGIPASHGCVRLRDPDAIWFYNNIPSGTLVIIHD